MTAIPTSSTISWELITFCLRKGISRSGFSKRAFTINSDQLRLASEKGWIEKCNLEGVVSFTVEVKKHVIVNEYFKHINEPSSFMFQTNFRKLLNLFL